MNKEVSMQTQNPDMLMESSSSPIHLVDKDEEGCFQNNLDHIAALEEEAILLLCIAYCQVSGIKNLNDAAEDVISLFNLPESIKTLKELIEKRETISRIIELKEDNSQTQGIQLNFHSLCQKHELNAFESQVIQLLFISETSLRFRAIFDGLDVPGWSGHRNELTIGTILSILCDGLADQVQKWPYFSIDSRLVSNSIISTESYNNQLVVKMDVALHERISRFILNDHQVYNCDYRCIDTHQPSTKLNQVVLKDDLKRDVVDYAKAFLDNSDQFTEFYGYGTGLTYLFFGASGTGKTMLAHALANHFGCKLFSLNVADIDNADISFDEALQYMFREARLVNGIVFLDECDDVLEESSDKSRDFLIQIEKSNCFTILATNKSERLDPALDRRIHLKVQFEIPDEGQRLAIWKALIPQEASYGPCVDLKLLAKKYFFTGGLIKNTILMAARKKALSNDICLTMDEIEHAASYQVASMFDDKSIGVSRTPKFCMDDLDLEQPFCDDFKRMASNWSEIQAKQGIGLVLSSSCFSHSMECVEALVSESGKNIRCYSFEDLVTGKEIIKSSVSSPFAHRVEKEKMVDHVFRSRTGQDEVLVLSDENGTLKEVLVTKYPREGWTQLLANLRNYSGSFILVTTAFNEAMLPPELPISIIIPEPSKEKQLAIWKKYLTHLSNHELSEIVNRFSMHISDIREVIEQARMNAQLCDGTKTPGMPDVISMATRKSGRGPMPILFGSSE